MGILKKLKSVLGMDGPNRPRARSNPDVTVEREPSTETEQAVKGSGPSDAPRAPRSANASTTETGSDAATDEAIAAETESGSDAAPAETPETESDESSASTSVEEIDGIGPTYAERLAAAGIESVADLADSDVETVADAARANQSRVEDWLEQARDR